MKETGLITSHSSITTTGCLIDSQSKSAKIKQVPYLIHWKIRIRGATAEVLHGIGEFIFLTVSIMWASSFALLGCTEQPRLLK